MASRIVVLGVALAIVWLTTTSVLTSCLVGVERSLGNTSVRFNDFLNSGRSSKGTDFEHWKDSLANLSAVELLRLFDKKLTASESFISAATTKHKRDGFCSILPPGISASTLWQANLKRIAKATRTRVFDDGADPSYPTWLEPLLSFLNPRFMRLAYRHPPLPASLDAVLSIIWKRLQDPAHNPPLRIAVLGGSVTQGRASCGTKDPDPPVDQKNSFQCAWIGRIQALANEFLGEGVIEVHNLASGGTNTWLATPLVEYRLFGELSTLSSHGPDVIVNSYSTNDALVLDRDHSVDVTNDIEWQDAKRQLHQNFLRAALRSRPCDPDLPLVAYVDDYVGNQHDRIMGEQSNYYRTMEMVDWYHTMMISFADAVRRIVVANAQEQVFSAYWPWHRGAGTKATNVHFGMKGHFSLSWVVAFGALQAVVDHCADEYDPARNPSPVQEEHPPIILDMVERGMPPPLTKETRFSTVSADWLEDFNAHRDDTKRICSQHKQGNETMGPCAMAFLAGPVGTAKKSKELKNYLRPFLKEGYVQGWDAIDDIMQGGWSNKVGYAVTNPSNATSTLVVENATTQVRIVRILYLKSYGEKWQDARVRFTLRGTDSRGSSLSEQWELEGFHQSDTSVAYPFDLDLKERTIPRGETVELEMKLVGGSNFKILSIMMCGH